MSELAPGWDVVARKTNRPISHFMLFLLQILTLSWPPASHSSVTFTVRNRANGETRKVTAKSNEEAATLIAQGQFDRA